MTFIQRASRSHRIRLGGSYADKILGYAPTLYWPLDDPAGMVGRSLVVSNAVENLVANPGFEYPYPSGQTFGAWIERAGTGAIADETAIVHAGSHALKLTYGSDSATWVYQYIRVTPGETLALSLWARGDGTNQGRYAVYDYNNAAWLKSFTGTGVTAAAYTEVTDSIVVPATCNVVMLYLAVPAAAGLCYFDDVSLTGLGTLDGSYVGAGVTHGVAGIGDGNPATLFSGTGTSFLTGCPRFNSYWNGDTGTAIAWGRLDAAGWADTSSYRYLFHVRPHNDADYYIVFGKTSTANRLCWRRKAGAGKSTNEVTYDFSP